MLAVLSGAERASLGDALRKLLAGLEGGPVVGQPDEQAVPPQPQAAADVER